MHIAVLAYDCRADDPRSNALLTKVQILGSLTPHVHVYLQSPEQVHEELPANTHILASGVPTDQEWECLAQADVVVVDVSHKYELLNLLPVLSRTAQVLADCSAFSGSPESMKKVVWWADVVAVPLRAQKQAVLRATGIPNERVQVLPRLTSVTRMSSSSDEEGARNSGMERISASFDETEISPPKYRVAVVSVRYGTDFVGGAETSLRTIAETLHTGGHHVEVFTTCTKSEGYWRNQLRTGTALLNGIAVHRFRVNSVDRKRHLESVRVIHQPGPVRPEHEADYIRHSVHSQGLLKQLAQRIDEFDAVIVGPYLFGLTHDVAHLIPGKCLVLPCFHDEPLAKLSVWRDTYEKTAGVLYHSREEQELAECQLGVNHPNSVVIGTFLAFAADANPVQSDSEKRIRRLVYCGRYSEQKGLPELLAFAQEYNRRHPGRFRFTFMGHGHVSIPREPWAEDLGFVDEKRKRQVLSSVDALVLLSQNESLSLVALEAWASGVPTIVHKGCDVLTGHLQRCGGGRAVDGVTDFCRVLNDLWASPNDWQMMGQAGQTYVLREYLSRERFQERLLAALRGIETPIHQLISERESQELRENTYQWRLQLPNLIRSLCRAQPTRVNAVRLRFQQPMQEFCCGGGELFLPMRIDNNGSHPLPANGFGRYVLCAAVSEKDAQSLFGPVETELPATIFPDECRSVVLSANVPQTPGTYQLNVWIEQRSIPQETHLRFNGPKLSIRVGAHPSSTMGLTPTQEVTQLLNQCRSQQTLSIAFPPVSGPWWVRWKEWFKRKLWNGFKIGYVDVLATKQSTVNTQLLEAVEQLTHSCSTLDHAVMVLQKRVQQLEAELEDAQKSPDRSMEYSTAETV